MRREPLKQPGLDVELLLRRGAPLDVSASVPLGVGPGPAPADEVTARRMERWRHQAARDDDARFAARLAWDGLTPDAAGWAVAGERPLDSGDEWWAAGTRRLIRHLEQDGATEACLAVHEGKDPRHLTEPPVPFSPVLAPLVRFAADEMDRSGSWASVSDFVRGQLCTSLYRRLSNVSHRPIGAEFRRFREARERRAGCWSSFVGRMNGGGLLELLERLPVLARLLGTVITLWLEDTSEFLNRLAGDCAEIARFLGEDTGEVVDIASDLSDSHRGGRRVRIVGFASGARVVYKPRSLDADLAWFQWMEWLRRREPSLDLRAPRVLPRGGWGWAEFIGHLPCRDLAAVSRFYRRAGCLLCLLHAVASIDFHEENLVAFAEYPVPVDLETVFMPELRAGGSLSDAALPYRRSVLQVGLLPEWIELGGQSEAVDMSALGSTPQAQPFLTVRGWIDVNSDEMEFVESRERRQASDNAPFLSVGECPDAGAFVEDVADGFRAAYDFLLSHRDALLSSDGPLEPFRSCRSRIPLRPTELYYRISIRSVNEAFLGRGVERSIEFEALSRCYLGTGKPRGGDAVFRAEVSPLEQLDVPIFETLAGTGEMLDANGRKLVADGFVRVPGYERVIQRLTEMSPEDCDVQIELIRASFAARDLGDRRDRGPESPPKAPGDQGYGASCAVCDEWLAAARKTALHLTGKALWSHGEACWIGFDTLPVSRRMHVQVLGPSLYSGSPGLAVFLAARFAVEGDEKDRKAALGVVRYLRRVYLIGSGGGSGERLAGRDRLIANGIGAAFGGGSTVYAMLATGRLLNDPEPIELASIMSRMIDEQAIGADQRLDVMSGAAGAILVFLALWKETREPAMIEKALMCGEHLLCSRLTQEDGPRAWRTIARRPLAGFSHGAAGIGLALLRLHRVLRDTRFRDAAIEGFDYERTLFFTRCLQLGRPAGGERGHHGLRRLVQRGARNSALTPCGT